jgi:hypothetical protein
MADRASQYSYITTGTTTQVKTGRARLRRIVVNVPIAAATIKIIDGTSGTTANVATITCTADLKPFFIDYNLICNNGLRIVTSGATDVTVVYE